MLFPGKSGFANAPQCYVTHTLPMLLEVNNVTCLYVFLRENLLRIWRLFSNLTSYRYLSLNVHHHNYNHHHHHHHHDHPSVKGFYLCSWRSENYTSLSIVFSNILRNLFRLNGKNISVVQDSRFSFLANDFFQSCLHSCLSATLKMGDCKFLWLWLSRVIWYKITDVSEKPVSVCLGKKRSLNYRCRFFWNVGVFFSSLHWSTYQKAGCSFCSAFSKSLWCQNLFWSQI